MASYNFVNIGSGNDLLPEPVLTDHEWSLVAFPWRQFHMKCPRYLSLIMLITKSRLPPNLPRAKYMFDTFSVEIQYLYIV